MPSRAVAHVNVRLAGRTIVNSRKLSGDPPFLPETSSSRRRHKRRRRNGPPRCRTADCAISPLLLGLIKRDVGLPDQGYVVGGAGGLGSHPDTDRDVSPARCRMDDVELSHQQTHGVRHCDSIFLRHVRKHDCELLTAISGCQAAGLHRHAADNACDAAQTAVARLVAQRVIEALEVVDQSAGQKACRGCRRPHEGRNRIGGDSPVQSGHPWLPIARAADWPRTDHPRALSAP